MTNKEAVEILKGVIKKPNTKDGYLGQAIAMAIEALEQQPKAGEWLKNGELCKCSRCHSLVLRSVVKSYNYCFRCGAKMV